MRLTAASTVGLLLLAGTARSHAVDEYLQASYVQLEPARISVLLKMQPGALTAPALFKLIDGDGNGVLSAAEIDAYMRQVLKEVQLTLDDRPLPLDVHSEAWPGIGGFTAAGGAMVFRLTSPLPKSKARGAGDSAAAAAPVRRIVFRNGHAPTMSVYQANVLAPTSPSIQVLDWQRDPAGREITVRFTQTP